MGESDAAGSPGAHLQCISAVTLACADMARSVAFYERLGFPVTFGGADQPFTSLAVGPGFLNLQLVEGWTPPATVWGRVIIWVDDVDAVHARARRAGMSPATDPADAPWGERYFHLRDPDGHELSFARPLG
jgi:catechol 2,3-dioxygenase-like lactoylglutathione lyase family enzyme